jgi:hypothetical protein
MESTTLRVRQNADSSVLPRIAASTDRAPSTRSVVGAAVYLKFCGDKKLFKSDLIQPEDVLKRMAALGMKQITLASLAEINPVKVNRFLRFHLSALNAHEAFKVGYILDRCEELALAFEPVSLNFRDADKVLKSLEFLMNFRSKNSLKEAANA